MSCARSQPAILGPQGSPTRLGLLRWLKFNFVGGLGILVQLGALAFCRSILRLNYLPATAVAVELAVIHNFAGHQRFTWRDRHTTRHRQSLTRFARFNAANGAVSIAGNLLVMRGLAGRWHLNLIVANLVAITLCSIVNYLLSDRWVFRRRDENPQSAGHLI